MNYPGIGGNRIVYAVGDVHGRLDLLDRLLARIDADRGRDPGARRVEVYLGDYVDRGPDGAGVVARLRRRAERPDVVCLRGNHEAMMLDALDGDDAALDRWLGNGGDATLASYGIKPEEMGRPSWRDRVPEADAAFLRALRGSYALSPYLFVHAGVRPGVPLDRQDPHDLAWIREGFLDFDGPLGAVVVHGHTPVGEVAFRPNRIGIDTGAVFTGRLTCLRIDGAGVSIL